MCGLVAYRFTRDHLRISHPICALGGDLMELNRVRIIDATIAFGGAKQPGLGREGSRHGLEAFAEIKYIGIHSRGAAHLPAVLDQQTTTEPDDGRENR